MHKCQQLPIIVIVHLSRCLLIEFKYPRTDTSVAEFDKLFTLMEKSSVVGYLISLGKKIIANKTTALDKCILLKVKLMIQGKAIHRASIGYGVLIWFVLPLSICKLHLIYRSCIREVQTITLMICGTIHRQQHEEITKCFL